MASYYVLVYLATALPAIGVRAVAQATGLPTAIEIFAGLVIVICLAGLTGLIAETRERGRKARARVARARAA